MFKTIKDIWEKLQDLMDVSGDAVMCVMTSVFICRVAMSAFGYPQLGASEAAVYASAIAAFGYSNK